MASILIFDFDETLAPEYAPLDAALQRVCARAAEAAGLTPARAAAIVRAQASAHWHDNPLDPWSRRIGISSWEALAHDFGDGGDPWRQIARWKRETNFSLRVWRESLAQMGLRDENEAIRCESAFSDARRNIAAELYPDALPCLQQMTANFRLALLTNGAACSQRRKIEAVGVARWFEAIAISGELGVGKPAPEAFEALLATLDARPGDCVMIGNSLSNDIIPAERMGIRGVWVNRDGALAGGAHCWAEVRNLIELQHIRELRQ